MRFSGEVIFPLSMVAILVATLTALPVRGDSSRDVSAILVPQNMRELPEVKAMITEYRRIVQSNPELCGDRKLFGLRTVTVDGKRQVRYYVDGKGSACIPQRLRPSEKWVVTQDGWTDRLQSEYERFIYDIGMAVESGACSNVDSCMISSANTLRTQTDLNAFHYADCADFPYYLRAYFSFRKGLPFSISEKIRARPPTLSEQARYDEQDQRIRFLMQTQKSRSLRLGEADELAKLLKRRELRLDPRYTANGNWIASRSWVTRSQAVAFYPWIERARALVSTANVRVSLNRGAQGFANGRSYHEQEPDFYSPALTSKAIRPGTVIYKSDGHIGVVYRIDSESGRIHFMDSHPDNSISFGVVDQVWIKGMVGQANLGGGFKNFRPILYDKNMTSVQPRMARDHELEDGYFSTEQYDLFPQPLAQVEYQDSQLRVKVGYLDFLRLRLTNGLYRIDPVAQFRDDLNQICQDIQTRPEAVWEATSKNIHLLPHPERLPNNIFGASGTWETFSTPSRDLRFRQRVVNIYSNLKRYKEFAQSGHPLLASPLTIGGLREQLLDAFKEIGENCRITYRDSRNQPRSLNLVEAIRRAPYMSYDPYACPERRFGATSQQELATCSDTPDKAEWHAYQQFLRNRLEKNATEPMGWSLNELRSIKGNKVDGRLLERLDLQKAIQAL